MRKQREVGLDVITEGEYTKGGDWLSFVECCSATAAPRWRAAKRGSAAKRQGARPMPRYSLV